MTAKKTEITPQAVLPPRYCSQCGGPLKANLKEDRPGETPPWICLTCGRKVYADPKLAVAAIGQNQHGHIALLRRAQKGPGHGLWVLPGGHVDQGEVVEQAAVREAEEELGLEASLEGLVGIYSYEHNPWVLIVYAVRLGQGPLNPNHESLQARYFAPAAIPWAELGFTSTGDALRDFLLLRPQKASFLP